MSRGSEKMQSKWLNGPCEGKLRFGFRQVGEERVGAGGAREGGPEAVTARQAPLPPQAQQALQGERGESLSLKGAGVGAEQQVSPHPQVLSRRQLGTTHACLASLTPPLGGPNARAKAHRGTSVLEGPAALSVPHSLVP